MCPSKLHAQEIQSSKLASLGELTAGIAHELKQPLQAVLGFSEEILKTENLSANGKECIQDIIAVSRKMEEIINSIRHFSHPTEEDHGLTSIDHAIQNSVRLMKHHLLQKGTDVEIECAASLPLVNANPVKFEQVLINILSNARDAIESSGNARGKIKVSAQTSQQNVEIKIRDNGCGMSEHTRSKIFEPFFTTKSAEKGTGLGMSISHGLLKKMHAEISIQSEIGSGSEFTITIPVFKPTTRGELHES